MVASLVGALIALITFGSIFLLSDMLGFLPATEKSTVLIAMSGATVAFAVLMQLLSTPLERLLTRLLSKKQK